MKERETMIKDLLYQLFKKGIIELTFDDDSEENIHNKDKILPSDIDNSIDDE